MDQQVFKEFWRLCKGYWQSEEKWRARGLLAVVMLLNCAVVYMLVLLNEWYNTFYNALQEYRYDAFWDLIGYFTLIAFVYIAFSVYAIYLRQMLQIYWRRWMTHRYLERWTKGQTYYKMQIASDGMDNPDQRISEDINLFAELTLVLFLGFLKQIAVLIVFIAILWRLSGVLTLPIGGYEVTVYGYMVWISLLYAAVGTFLTTKVGSPLIRLNYDQQRYEADFRFNLVRLRENGESVAFYGGEQPERTNFFACFDRAFKNYWQLMKYGKRLTWFVSGYGQLAIIFPILMAAPRYFAREIQIGGVMQILNAFGKVQDALSYFVDSYASIAQWTAVVKRLGDFTRHMEIVEQTRPGTVQGAGTAALRLSALTVALPQGQVLVSAIDLTVERGDRLLVTGASGCGKSTLLRTIAGIWPYGSGEISMPAGARRLFLPQRPYLPLGSLRNTLFYPEEKAADGARVEDVLQLCKLEHLLDRLDAAEDWGKILSLGEQQRVAFARLLLLRPAWAFLDEATSALDEPTERAMYELIAAHLPDTAVISIGHRGTLARFHRRKLHIEDGNWRVAEIEIEENAAGTAKSSR